MKQTTICALCAALLMTGCGGGGGGASSGISPVPPAPITLPPASNTAARAIPPVSDSAGFDSDTAAQQFSNFDESTPTAKNLSGRDSVSQSTNVDSANKTKDSADVAVSGPAARPNFLVDYRPQAGDSVKLNPDILSESQRANTNDIGSFSAPQTYRRFGIGGINGIPIDINNDNVNESKIWFNGYTNYEGEGDTDYILGGNWLFAPSNLLSSHLLFGIGSFVAIPDSYHYANANSSGTATYEGGAEGYTMYNFSANLNFPDYRQFAAGVGISFYTGRVRLNANFGSSPSINGRVYIEDSVTGNTGELVLESARINTAEKNFFSSSLSGELYVLGDKDNIKFDGMEIPRSDLNNFGSFEQTTGRWGGMFFGDSAETQPEGVIGTFVGRDNEVPIDDGQGTRIEHGIIITGSFGAFKK